MIAQNEESNKMFNNIFFKHVQILRGGGGGDRGSGPPHPLKNKKNIGFLSNTVPDPLKNRKATKPALNFGPSSACQQNAFAIIGLPVKRHLMAFRWRADDGPLLVLFRSSFPS